MPTHGSLTKAGKVRSQTPKVQALGKTLSNTEDSCSAKLAGETNRDGKKTGSELLTKLRLPSKHLQQIVLT